MICEKDVTYDTFLRSLPPNETKTYCKYYELKTRNTTKILTQTISQWTEKYSHFQANSFESVKFRVDFEIY